MNRSSQAPLFLSTFALLTLPSIAAADSTKPIVAVFTVEAKGINLDSAMLDRLTAYLTGAVAATGHYQVVPQDQLKRRLNQQKQATYRSCYERSCQIEIGKELAAQKTLATQVIKLGTKCALTATLFDLKRAAAERAATARGGCSEDAIVSSLEKAVTQLAPKAKRTSLVMRTVDKLTGVGGLVGKKLTTFVPQTHVAVDFRTTPRGAAVFLDGRAICTTPCRANLKKRPYELVLERRHYQTVKRPIVIAGRQVVHTTLQLSGAGQWAMKERWEFMTVEGLFGMLATTGDAGTIGGALLQGGTLKWGPIFWSTFEFGAAGGGVGVVGLAQTRLGYRWFFGESDRHELRLGLGIGLGVFGIEEELTTRSDSSAAFSLSPTVEYRFVSRSFFNVGVGVRAALPISTEFADYPMAILLSVPFGFQLPGV